MIAEAFRQGAGRHAAKYGDSLEGPRCGCGRRRRRCLPQSRQQNIQQRFALAACHAPILAPRKYGAVTRPTEIEVIDEIAVRSLEVYRRAAPRSPDESRQRAGPMRPSQISENRKARMVCGSCA